MKNAISDFPNDFMTTKYVMRRIDKSYEQAAIRYYVVHCLLIENMDKYGKIIFGWESNTYY